MTGLGWWRRFWRGEQKLVTTHRWNQLVEPSLLATIMTVSVTDRFHAKQGRSTGRWVVPTRKGDRLVVYLKRHYQLPWWQRLLALCWPSGHWSPATQEWKHLRWCLAHGVPVPEPLAYGEYSGPGLRLQSFLAIAELTDMEPLHEMIPDATLHLPPDRMARWKRHVVAKIAHVTKLLHDQNRFHKDLYLCHFYLPASAIGVSAAGMHLIDLHRLGHHPWLGWRWQVKDLAQLLYSSYIAGVTNRDRLRFLHQYLNCRKLDTAGRRLLLAVQAKAAKYLRHNAKRMTTHEDRAVPRKSAA